MTKRFRLGKSLPAPPPKKFHFGHFFRGLIPVYIALLAVSFGLLIASCNDSAIPEVEFPVPDEEQVELIRPSTNPEPPELVQDYYDLVDEIEKDYLDGVEDSTKILQVTRMAVELSKYHGSMALIFKLEEAKSQGKSKEELQGIAYEHYGLNRLQKTNSPCVDECADALGKAVEKAIQTLEQDKDACGIYAIGAMTGGLVGGPLGAAISGASVLVPCGIVAYRDYHNGLEDADDEFGACIHACPE